MLLPQVSLFAGDKRIFIFYFGNSYNITASDTYETCGFERTFEVVAG